MPIDVASSIKFTATDTEPTSDKGRIYYDDSESALKHHDGDNWAQVYPNNTTRSGDGQYDVDSYTKLLIHSDTTNNSTRFADSSSGTHTITATNANHSTTQAKLGVTSIYFDGTGDYISIASHDDFTIGTGDYTIDAWVYMLDDDVERFFLSGDGVSQGNFHMGYRGDYDPKVWNIRWYDGSSVQAFTIEHDITIDSWHHVAIVFSGGDTISLFYDGVRIGTASKAYNQPAEGMRVGVLEGYLTSTACYNGYIDEIRFSKGIARWTSNFTVY
jgi:hypothetical protein